MLKTKMVVKIVAHIFAKWIMKEIQMKNKKSTYTMKLLISTGFVTMGHILKILNQYF